MRSLWLLHELELAFDLVVHPFGPDLYTPEYRSIHPLGRVPCLVDGDVTLFESGAIAEYLCETYARQGSLWRSPGSPDRAAWLQWLHYAETIAVHVANLTQQHIVIWEDAQRSPMVMKLEARRLAKALAVVEKALAGRDWMLPSGFSAVDTGIGYSVYAAQHFCDISSLPNIRAYLDRCALRPAFASALPPDDAPRLYARPFYAEPGKA
ncbi:glutathione S-transferase family protein [Algicella marina]|nr:glutathione S-transferase family protein [Algicella marina]